MDLCLHAYAHTVDVSSYSYIISVEVVAVVTELCTIRHDNQLLLLELFHARK